MSEENGNLSIAVKKELSSHLVLLRSLAKRTQLEQAEIFGISERSYKRWEESGPTNFSWEQWDTLYKEAAKQTGRNHRKEINTMILKILNSTKHIKSFLESFLDMGNR